jgi:hypothetical protein
MTPALAQLHGEVVALQAGALAEYTRRKYESYELCWVRFLLLYGLMAYVAAPLEGIVSLNGGFLARTLGYSAVKTTCRGCSASCRSMAGLAFF